MTRPVSASTSSPLPRANISDRKVPLFDMDDDSDDRIRINNIAADGKFDVESNFVKGSDSKRKKLCRKGIPPSYRTQMWPRLISYKCDKALLKPTGWYKEMAHELFNGGALPPNFEDVPDFGSTFSWDHNPHPLAPSRVHAAKTLLCLVASNNPGINHCPFGKGISFFIRTFFVF